VSAPGPVTMISSGELKLLQSASFVKHF
jgi:hypothetical protein